MKETSYKGPVVRLVPLAVVDRSTFGETVLSLTLPQESQGVFGTDYHLFHHG